MNGWKKEWIDRGIPLEEYPTVNEIEGVTIQVLSRVTACDNRPGLKRFYVTVLDDKGEPIPDVPIFFDVYPSKGIIYDHPNWWGVTDENGYVEWDHLGKPTRYVMWVGSREGAPLIENIRTDLGNEYCKPPGSSWWSGNVPVNRPGIYSYRIEVQKKG